MWRGLALISERCCKPRTERLCDGGDSSFDVERGVVRGKALADLPVSQFVNRWLTEHLGFETQTRRKSRGLIDPFHRLQKSLGLLGVRDQSQLERELHYLGVYNSSISMSTIARLLSWLKPEVSGAEVYL